MKRLLVPFLLISPLLHSEEKSGIDISISQFNHIATSNKPTFNGQSLGIGIRISDPDRPKNVLRATIEKGLITSGYGSDSISNIDNYLSLSCDYVWHHSEQFFLGAGVRTIKFDVEAPLPSQFATMSTTNFGTNHSTLPQFIVGFRFATHISIELDTSIIQNNLQLRCSF
jgi:hypothetical protein